MDQFQDDTALLLTIGGAFDLGGRILLIISSFFITVKARYTFLIGVIMTILFRCGENQVNRFDKNQVNS